jgi:hypothetical protein
VAEEFVEKFAPKWAPTYATKIKDRLAWLHRVVGDTPVSQVRAPDLLNAIRPLAAAGKVETACRTGGVAGQLIRYAIATGRADSDPTAALRRLGYDTDTATGQGFRASARSAAPTTAPRTCPSVSR